MAKGQASFPAPDLAVTNLSQAIQLLGSNEALVRDVRLEATVCAVSDPMMGVVILQDETDAELVELSGGAPELAPGDKVRIERRNCLLRRREMGLQISAAPVLDNNGLREISMRARGGVGLKKGRHAITFEWFNRVHPPVLEVEWQMPGSQAGDVPFTNVFYTVSTNGSGAEIIQPGLLAESYEGDWERVPNFNLLEPVKTGVVTHFDLGIRTRDEFAAVRFRGFFDAPRQGVYEFAIRSVDGSLLFVDELKVPVIKVEKVAVPIPGLAMIGEPLSKTAKHRWVSVEGRVGSVSSIGRGIELKLYSGRNWLQVRIADAAGLSASNILNSTIRVTGVGCSVFNLQGDSVLGQVFAANAQAVELLQLSKAHKTDTRFLTKSDQVQTLTLDDAKRQLPVHLRGVVTGKGGPYDFWISVQDETRGIFVDFHNASNCVPMCGDYYEILGKSGAGDFAPVVLADRLVRLGKGELPDPLHPTLDELNNGSMDVQWVEFRGLVAGIRSNTLSMLLPSGQMDVQVDGISPSNLQPLKGAVVRIRGVLFAIWNAAREVRIGSILMRNASITVETPPPADPFDAVLKTPRELLLFDAQAAAFRRVKVRGQIVYVDSNQVFLEENGEGIRLLPAAKTKLTPGDLVEAVGYPNISRDALLLREAVIRKTGQAKLPPAKNLPEPLANLEGLDSTRVRIEGQLLGWHFEQGAAVLEMQTGTHLYLARLARLNQLPLRADSQLALQGVFLSQRNNQRTAGGSGAFELLLNSTDDIQVLAQPPWWTLERMLILIGILVTVLVAGAVWITQLRRLVEQRTVQLQREIHERELAEQQRALEVERSRIARDLHDDLGASLTEIAVLAGKGQRTNSPEPDGVALFRSITAKARELVAALDIIVWAVDPKDNSLQSVADYLCDFTDEFLSPSGITCRFDVPVTLPAVVLEGRLRHDLFLAVKETLNNIVRHAGATGVEFKLAVENGLLEIVIVDNGKGFDANQPQAGKGQKSLPLRLSKIGGRYEIKSAAGSGTVVKISLPLPAPKKKR